MRHCYNLGFISEADIYAHVKDIVLRYRTRINLAEFNANIADPIKLTFDAKVYGMSMERMIESECIRQIDKSNNGIADKYFHQILCQGANSGWKMCQGKSADFDIQNQKLNINVILKNRRDLLNVNTCNKLYIKMQDCVLNDKTAICMLVEIGADRDIDETWEIKRGKLTFKNDRIRHLSIDKFYEIVFHDEKAYGNLCETLPTILDDVISSLGLSNLKDATKTLLKDNLPSNYLKTK